MNSKTMKNVMALGAGGALIAGTVAIATASPARALPVLSNTAATGTSNQVTDVHYYRHGYHHRGYYRPRYYRRGYGYPYGGYAYPYAYPYSYSYPFGYGWGGWGGWGW